ncbi:hypothetical protein HN954_04475 [bacterium]|jgi:hypothetical protein|nr:hypothetical protein [bacterium]MBT6831958.1 hypothetical protein [bacterium]MBT6996654.1 hypothetical protein [bacterium]MBT7773074.1 hypothetical protein [bacterium]
MLENLILGIASLASSTPTPFFEEKFELPAATFELSTENEWNAVTIFTPDGSPAPDLKFRDPETGNWKLWEISEENKSVLEMVFFADPVRSLQLKSETKKEVVAHFFNTRIPGENLVAQLGTSDQSLLSNENLPEELRFLSGEIPKFFSRADWGADESLRLEEVLKKKLKPGQILRRWFQPEIAIVPPKYRPVVTQTENENGKSLFWPIRQNPKIEKFIVHHTAENESSQNRRRSPKELMRAIYFYHTVTNGWGDIGYNYVIDKQGNIYEGRAGGPKSVGAHVAYHNVGSIGICLMGNFQTETPTDAQLHVLSLLIADLAIKFEIDPLGRTEFLGKNSYNISGHSQVARYGHGTACPGKNLLKLLPDLRTQVKKYADLLKKFEDTGPKGKDFLSKSRAAPNVYAGEKKFSVPEKTPIFSPMKNFESQLLHRNQSLVIEAEVRNTSDENWEKDSALVATNVPDGMTVGKLYLVEKTRPDRIGKFRAEINVKTTPNGKYFLKMSPKFLEEKLFSNQLAELAFDFPVQVSGDVNLVRSDRTDFVRKNASVVVKKNKTVVVDESVEQNRAAENAPKTKIKLAGFDQGFAEILSNQPVGLWSGDRKIAEIPAFVPVKISTHTDSSVVKLRVKVEKSNPPINLDSLREFSMKTAGTLTIENYRNPRFGSATIPYNQFRNQLNFYPQQNEKLLAVNELSIEKYLWGLGEEPSTEPETKRHTIHVLARSYALVYSTDRRKFGTELYDLEDDPKTSQLYLGKMWENYHSEQKNLVLQTSGKVLTKNGTPVIGPYFTQSDGKSVNPWASQYPWCRARELPHDAGLVAKGHGVGLSGNSARTLAEQGKSMSEIVNYFFDGLEIRKIY